MNVWITADLHLGHQLVAELRGFTTTADHDQAVLDGINRLPRGAQLWILGDLSAGGRRAETAAFDALRSVRHDPAMHLIAGNHDSCHPMHRTAHRRLPAFLDGPFASVQSATRRRYNGRPLVLSHFPYGGDHGPDRFTQWRLRDLGVPIIHGHTHSTRRYSRSGAGTPQVCVGLDAWDMRPASIDAIYRVLDEGATR